MFPNSRTNLSAAACTQTPRPQTAREDHPSPDGTEREAAAYAADLLQRQPEARCPDEGATGRDDRPQPASDPRLVPEQAVQGQEEKPADEATATATTQRQDGESADLLLSSSEAPDCAVKSLKKPLVFSCTRNASMFNPSTF